MIRCDDKGTLVKGSTADVITDLACIVAAVRDTFLDVFDEELTDELIALSGRMGFMDASNSEHRKLMLDELDKIVSEAEEREKRKKDR